MKVIYIMQYILYALELMACITGFLCWKKLRNTPMRWFPFYLAFIGAAELICAYLNSTGNYELKRNILNYLVIPAEFLFLYSLYYKYSYKNAGRKMVMVCASLYVLAFIVEQLFVKSNKIYMDSFSYSVGNLSLLVVILAFLIQFAKSDEILRFRQSPMFWISLGMLVFYLGTLPYFGMLTILYKQYKPVYIWYTYLMYVCNWFMYCMFMTGFIWGKQK